MLYWDKDKSRVGSQGYAVVVVIDFKGKLTTSSATWTGMSSQAVARSVAPSGVHFRRGLDSFTEAINHSFIQRPYPSNVGWECVHQWYIYKQKIYKLASPEGRIGPKSRVGAPP